MASYRDIYLIIRARDETSRVMRGMGRNMAGFGRMQERINEQMRANTERTAQTVARAQRDMDQALDRRGRNWTAHQRRLQTQERNTIRAMEATMRVSREANSVDNHRIGTINRLLEERRQLFAAARNARNEEAQAAAAAALAERRRQGETSAGLRMERAQLRERVSLRNEDLARQQTALTRERNIWQDRNTRARRNHDNQVRMIRQRGAVITDVAKQQEAVDNAELERQQQYLQRQAEITQSAMVAGQAMMMTGVAMSAAGLGAVRSFSAATDAAIEFSEQASGAMRVSKGMADSVDEVKDALFDVAAVIPVPLEDLEGTLYRIFTALEVNIEEARQLLVGFAREAVVGQADIEDAARSTIAMLNAYGMTVEDLTRIQEMQWRTIEYGQLTYDELSENIGKIIPSATRAGQEIEVMGASLAFLTRQGLSAEMAATAAARGIELFTHPTVVGRLDDLGIKMKDARGEFLPLVDIFRNMNEEMDEMTAPERSAMLQEVFTGSQYRIQARRFFDLVFNDFERFEWFMERMTESGNSFGEALEVAMEEPAFLTGILTNRMEMLRIEIGDKLIPVKLALVRLVTDLLDRWNNLNEETRTTIVRSVALGTALAGIGGTVMALTGFLMLMSAMMAGAIMQMKLATGAVAAMKLAFAGLLGVPLIIGAIVVALILLAIHWERVVEWVTSFEAQVALAIGIIIILGAQLLGLTGIVSTFAGAITGATAAVGRFVVAKAGLLLAFGKIAIVVGTVIGVYKIFTAESERAAEAQDYLSDKLDGTESSMETLSDEMLISYLKGKDVFEIFMELGISLDLLRDAVDGNEEAQKKLNEQIDASEYKYGGFLEILPGVRNENYDLERSVDALIEGHKLYNNELANTVQALGGVTKGQREYHPALKGGEITTEGLGDATSELTAQLGMNEDELFAAAAGNEELASALGITTDEAENVVTEFEDMSERARDFHRVLSSINNPATAFNDALSNVQDAIRETHEQALESGDITSQALQDMVDSAVDDAGRMASAWLSELREQQAAHEEFEQNLIDVVNRGAPQDVVDQILAMGEQAPAALRALNAATEPEFNELVDLLSSGAERASEDTAKHFADMSSSMVDAVAEGMEVTLRDFSLGMRLLAVVAATGGEATAAELVRELDAGARDISRVANKYNINLAEGVNPLLSAIGAEEVRVQNIARRYHEHGTIPGGANKGGWIPGGGPDRDSVMAWLTPGEYVIRRKAAQTLGPTVLDELNNADRYQRGGSVTGDVVGVHPELMRRLQAWSAGLGQTYNITSGYRSIAQQQVLYNRWRRGQGAPAAVPGRSMHNFGLASDGPRWGGRGPQKYGLVYPMSYEPWHVEPIGGRAMRGDANAAGGIGQAMWFDLPEVPDFPANGIAESAPRFYEQIRSALQEWVDENAFRPINMMGTENLPDTGPLRDMARSMLSSRGWGQYWGQFNELVRRESSWNPTAQNPTSTAYGLGQFLDSTWATVGGRKTSDPRLQLQYMMRYIAQRYGDPSAALGFHNRNNWYNSGGRVRAYAKGGMITEPIMGVGMNTGGLFSFGEQGNEAIIPAASIVGLIRDAMQQVLTPSEDDPILAKDQFSTMQSAIQAFRGQLSAQQELVSSKREVRDLSNTLDELGKSYSETAKALQEAEAIGEIVTLEREREVLQQQQNVERLRAELDRLQSGPGAREELAIMRQAQRVSELQKDLEGVDDPDPDLMSRIAEAQANVAEARFEVSRVGEIAPHIDNETEALLMKFKAQAMLADAEKELAELEEQHVIPTGEERKMLELELAIASEELAKLKKHEEFATDKLRLADIELALAEKELLELQEDAVDFIPEYYEAKERLEELSNEMEQTERQLEAAVRGVTDAELGAMQAVLGLTEATQELNGLQPKSVDFFRTIAEEAGVAGKSLNEMITSVMHLNRANLQMSEARRKASGATGPGAARDRDIIRSGSMQDIKDRITSIFSNRNVPLGLHLSGEREDPAARLERLARSVSTGQTTFSDLRSSVDRIKKAHGLAQGGIVKRRLGGILAQIGEGQHDEAVIPLPHNWNTGSSGSGDNYFTFEFPQGAVQINIEGDVTEEALPKVQEIVEDAIQEMKDDWYDTLSRYVT